MKILPVILLCSIAHFPPLFAQTKQEQKKLDSLISLIKQDKEDTTKVNHLNQLGREYTRANIPGKDTAFCRQAIELAEKLGDINGMADGYKHIGGAYWTRLINRPSALINFFKALDLYKKAGNLYQEMGVNHIIGYVYYGMDSFNVALKYGFRALQLNEQVKNAYYQAAIPDNIGDYYSALDDYPNALKYYLDALKAIEASGDVKRIPNYLENIGTLYNKMGDYKNAILCFDSSLAEYERVGDYGVQKGVQSSDLLDLGITYKAKKKYGEALDYISKANQLAENTSAKIMLAKCSEMTGEIYKEEGDYEKALEYEMEALKRGEEFKYLPITVQSRGVIGEIYTKLKNYKEAEKYLLAAVASVHGSHQLEEEKNYELDLSRLYSATGELKKSLDCYAKYDSLKDSLVNREKSMQIGRIEAKVEFDRQLAAQQAEEDKEKTLAETKSKRQQIVNLLVILIASVLALIVFIIYRSWMTAKKEKGLVEKEKMLMELKALRAQMNPHFIFNAINSIQNFILENDQDSAQKHLTRFSKLMRMVLDNSGYENIPLADEIKMLELYLEFETVRFSSRFTYKIIVDNNISKETTFISPLIIQPYVENAIWHGLMHLSQDNSHDKARLGEVTIHFEIFNNQLKCTVDDNGIGRVRSMELKKDSVHKSMGLSITNERMEIMNSLFKSKMSVKFVDKVNPDGTPAGTRVELMMPLHINTKPHA
jgi:tetratricopeptide (TPR) repeat protein